MAAIDKILELLEERKVSAAELAAAVGISRSSISGWKKREYEPSSEAISKIANYFNVTTDYILDGDMSHDEKMIELNFNGIKSWTNNTFLHEDEKQKIREHFADVLLKYKTIVNHFVDLSMGHETNPTADEALLKEVDQLVHWCYLLPHYFISDYDGMRNIEHTNRVILTDAETEMVEAMRELSNEELAEIRGMMKGFIKAKEMDNKEGLGSLDSI